MRHTYIYGLMIALIVLASCTKKPVHHMHHTGSTPTPMESSPEETTSTPSEEAPPAKATWLQGTSDAGIYRTGNPYKVNGIWHFPQKELDAKHDEIGEATWYGTDYHNKMTANGEIFDMHGFTAAHKTLPLPSVVRVTNLSNKKSVILRVNDRGPFDNKRIIDVSKKAAELLGFLDQGSAKVRVQVLPEESMHVAGMAKGTSYNPQKTLSTQAGEVTMSPVPMATAPITTAPPVPSTVEMPQTQTMTAEITEAPPLDPPNAEVLESILPQQTIEIAAPIAAEAPIETPPPPVSTPAVVAPTAPVVQGTTYIQAGAYRNKTNAENAVKKLQKIAPAELTEMSKGSQPLYRVRVGPFPHKHIAHQKLKEVVSVGHPDATVVG